MKVGISALDDENSGVGSAMDDEKKIWSWRWCWMMKNLELDWRWLVLDDENFRRWRGNFGVGEG